MTTTENTIPLKLTGLVPKCEMEPVQPEELRIGNLVRNKNGDILPAYPELILMLVNQRQRPDQEQLEVYPVRLSRIILSKILSNNLDAKFENVIMLIRSGILYWGEEKVEIEYLHKLQNFYYIVEKKELDVSSIKKISTQA